MRNTYDSLWNGRRDNLFIGNNILIDLKTSENNQILYVFNLNENNQEITVFSELFSGSILRNLFTNVLTQINDGQVTIQTNSLEAMFFIIED
ncbi:MAG: hypothetical protein PHF05_01400 [Candidatus Izemoplasmatales bacterium]|nr:hypothetical protein [Candidatus Izemoplasmatales bacterium]MDY0138170.1 hypothetical protein [Candidatus Izemoplasmatales bacterium]